VGQERLGPSHFFISLVLGPLNSLLWYVPSSRYIWSLAPIFLFLQEQIKGIIIKNAFKPQIAVIKDKYYGMFRNKTKS
jgi:hypothetical protein